MPVFNNDQINNLIKLHSPPRRIISIVPSQTELLFDLGLHRNVVGITKFCIRPNSWFKTKKRIGGTKTVNIEAVKALQPDLIIANKEENVKEQIEALQKIAPVWVSDVSNLHDALEMVTAIGQLINKQEQANELCRRIMGEFDQFVPLSPAINTAYMIWKDPYMAAGGDTFINDMLRRCGLHNIFNNVSRYPEITITASTTKPASPPTDISQISSVELLLLSSEPYPFKQKHVEELRAQLPHCQIVLVDGEMFSWYGSRLLHAPAYFKKLIKQIQG